MIDYLEIALKWLRSGYSVIPVSISKRPTISNWMPFKNRPMTIDEAQIFFKDAQGIALVGGVNGITILDFDMKYSLRPDFMTEFRKRLKPSILAKCLIQKTQSGGYHLIFRCSDIVENNKKLARRFTTEHEKHETYMEAYENPCTRNNALKIAQNDKSRVLIETRGNGGYALIYPTRGYERIGNTKIGELTKDEYFEIMDLCRSFDELTRVPAEDTRFDFVKDQWEVSPFEDYNQRGDVLSLLQQHGWTVVQSGNRKYYSLKRPGKSTAPTSAHLFKDSNVLQVFSTSTEFNTDTGYNPIQIFCKLEAGDNISEAYKLLLKQGYGVKKKINK